MTKEISRDTNLKFKRVDWRQALADRDGIVFGLSCFISYRCRFLLLMPTTSERIKDTRLRP